MTRFSRPPCLFCGEENPAYASFHHQAPGAAAGADAVFTVVVFALVQAPPGDFLTSYVAMLASSGSSMDAAQVEALKHQFGLDQPVHVQYLLWLGSIVRGDLGCPSNTSGPARS